MPVITKMVGGCVRSSRIRVLLALFALGVATLAILPSTAGAAGGVLRVACNYSNSKQVDPIVSFGRSTSAHMHDFYGNTGVTANSTLSSLLSTPSNCRGEPQNHSGYWVPTMYLRGQAVHAPKLAVYYSRFPGGQIAETIPQGLKMVAGNHDATGPQPIGIVKWDCLGNPQAPLRAAPYNCAPYHATVQATIKFPNCWNGKGLNTSDVVYPGKHEVCPPGFPHILPHIRESIETTIVNPLNANGSVAISFSSGPYYTLHADVFEAWEQSRINFLLRSNGII